MYLPINSKSLNSLDYVFNAIFMIEFTIKVISLGFMIDHNTYITDSWNKLDFLIVMFSIIDMANTGQDLSYIKVNNYYFE
jgi:hypothetical protein